MHYQCSNCGKMIQDVWRKVLVRNEKTGEELNFCSDSCKEEFDKKSCK